ncbi:MAG: COX15/CtaA family protein [Alphaproteobacteria bacterium]
MSRLRSITGVTIILTFLLILLGAWVRATNSGLSCPDWPTCYGYWVPLPGSIPADAGYAYYQVMLEWVHRLIAGVLVGPLVLIIALCCWRARGVAGELPAFGAALVVLLLVQVSLGAVTVLDQNSPWSVAVHKTTALLLFATLWMIVERAADRRIALGTPGLRLHALVGWLLLLATIAAAAVMSKSGASLACASPFLCNDSLLPDFDDPLERLHMIHRLLAYTSFVVLALLGWRVRREERLRGLDRAIGLLLIVQIALGMLTVFFEVPIWLALLHQANGILLFAKVSWLLARILQAQAAESGETGSIRTSAPSPTA